MTLVQWDSTQIEMHNKTQQLPHICVVTPLPKTYPLRTECGNDLGNPTFQGETSTRLGTSLNLT